MLPFSHHRSAAVVQHAGVGEHAGVEQVAVDVSAKRGEVAYDAGAATPAQIDATLEEEGYPPS